ncbi:hypothetical protein GUITHDRAFT_86078 [Guillardia theta CCMP2712]|uniref:Threonine dehydratase n=1 Tax=Guillardia theta (strain CCMP2712) TaxID=905079 RepID=L1JJK2_GUITC|nr:hypothetical protein GUITHDRAFT_86078 [Guillardia theta CCMP2712]EKX48314.1 hypothetical protein GUITHDRAFT_86078 [Guillardia theta CCMP2712]|eukprot:XP_005835294.1 hypothetical protein GUITHDRAFT_86078 [Guillardia theta CCMP2712]
MVQTHVSTGGEKAGVEVGGVDGVWYLEQILTAKVYDVAVETPLHDMPRLSERLEGGNMIMAKREDMQPVFSFKLRGAYNMIANLDQAQLDRGVITASAGNHAQGVAMSAKHLGCRAVIAMPTVTPAIKVNSVKRMGAEVVLVGDNFDETKAYALERSEKDNMVFIPPFDHPLVIAGQGTIGLEILRQCSKPIDAIFIPVGGGGLIAGVAAYVKRLRPDIKIIGVEPTGADAMYRSLKEKKQVVLDKVDTFADGVAVKTVGSLTFKLALELVDEIVLVDTDEICVAIKDIFEDTRSITEPSGALAVAGAKKWLTDGAKKGSRVVAITSGANMNFDKLRLVADRAGSGEKEEAMLASIIPEKKGEFRKFINILSKSGLKRGGSQSRSITEFKYRYNERFTSQTGNAQVFYSVDTANRKDTETLVQELNDSGLKTLDLSKNELAKEHIRFLAGGGTRAADERLFKIEFPERPGSLRSFLDVLGEDWNISLFHYRATGQLVGSVLLGVSPMGEKDVQTFKAAIAELGWACVDTSDNVACALL